MTIFKLKTFPNVCRMCLQPKPSAEMISLDSYRPLFGRSIAEMLDEISGVRIPLKLACYLPTELCEQCLDVFEFFYKYRRKLDLVQRFAEALAEVKCGNRQPLEELFEAEKSALEVLFKDLDLCDREDFRAADLLEEFYEYDIASTICVKVESASDLEDRGEGNGGGGGGGSGSGDTEEGDAGSEGDFEADLAELGLELYREEEEEAIGEGEAGAVEEQEKDADSGKEVVVGESVKNFLQEFQKSLEEDQEIEPDGDAVPAGLHDVLEDKEQPVALVEGAPSEVTQSEVPSEVAHSEIAHSEISHSEIAHLEVAQSEVPSEVTMLVNFITYENDDDEEEDEEYEEDDEGAYVFIDGSEPDLGDSSEPSAGKRRAKRRKYNRFPEEEGELQQCSIHHCRFITAYPSQFEKHLVRYHTSQQDVLACHRTCCLGETFETIDLLRQHKNDVHSTHICMDCGKVTKHLIALENHQKQAHGRGRERAVPCTICEDKFRSAAEVERHIAKDHGMRFLHECPECGLGFKLKLLLTQHLLTHSVERKFNCEQCGNSFKTSNHLRRHIKTVHDIVMRYPCELCPVSYGRKDKLRMHMERVHEIQTYFVCDICCTSFESNDKLEEHKRRHEKPEDLECGICLTACPSVDEFNEHLCITYQDDYVCCRRDFRYHSYYNRHMFLAHGVRTNARVKPKTGMLMGKQRAMRKPVERCTLCDQVFPTRRTKKEHMETCAGKVVIFAIEPIADTIPDSFF